MATILIVDDQPDAGHLLERVMEFIGHHGVHVPSGEDALAYVQKSPPDAILLDYMMPGMDGLAVLQALRSNPHTRALPIIIFSAVSDPRALDQAMRAGASDYWVKTGVHIEEIELRLSRWLTLN